MVGFLFGGETGVESPQELARKRAQIAAMQGQVASANPRSFGEGLTAIGRALASRISDRQIGAREEEERARAGSAFSQIAGQLGGGGYGGGYSRPAPVSAAVPPVTSSPISTPNTAGLPQGIVDAVDRVNPLQPHPVAPAQPVSMPAGNAPENWEQIRNGIFAGESNGDYNALFGFSNRDGGPFSDVQLTDMTVDQALNFAAPSGPYGQWVRDQVGHVATPMGGYQIVGTTLRAAKEGLGLTGNEQMTPELQDLLGQWIYRAQGTDAWEGYRGPQSGAPSGGGSFSGGGSGGGGMSGGGMNPQIIAQLAELASNPYLPEGQRMIAQQLIQTQLQGMDPMRQLEMQRAQMEIEAMRNPQADNFRPTTPEEAAMYGGFGQMGPDGRFYPLAPPPEPQAPTTKNVTMPDGSEVMVQWNPETRNWDAAPIPEGGTSGTGAPADLTEKQAQTTLFSSMQDETRPVLEQIESIWNPANIADAAARSSPIGGNFFTSEQGQIYNTAAAAWAEGALRISTGAAATEPEIQRITRTYFAVAGDTPNVIEFKRSMREMYSRAINASLGYDTSGQGTLVLPDAFAEQYMSENPPPADMDAPASGAPDADGWVTIDGVRIRRVP
jgi:hypothetical protein